MKTRLLYISLSSLLMGIILHKSGKPYNGGVFTIHKLATIIYVVFTINMLIAFLKTHEPNALTIAMIIVAAVSLLGILFSGGAMSLNKSQEFVLAVHRISTVVFLFMIALGFYAILHANR